MDSLDTSALPALAVIVPLAGIGVLVLASFWQTRGKKCSWWLRLPRPSAGLVGLLFLVVWCLLSLVYSTYGQLAGATAVFTVCGFVAGLRHRMEKLTSRDLGLAAEVGGSGKPNQNESRSTSLRGSSRRGAALRVVRDALVLVVSSILACLALELPWNPDIMTSLPTFWWMELGLVALALIALYFLGQRHGTLPAVGVAVCMVIGFIQYYVALFRGTAIMPSDVYSVGTAVAVGGSYSYVLQGPALASICCAIAAMTLLGFVRPVRGAVGEAAVPANTAGTSQPKVPNRTASSRPSCPKRSRASVITCAAAGIAASLALAGVVSKVSFASQGVEVEYFFTLDKYREQGFLPSFIATAQDMPIKEPVGYTSVAARQIEADYVARASEIEGIGESDANPAFAVENVEGSNAGSADAPDNSSTSTAPYKLRQEQFDEIHPTVIAVMDETFSDLSIYSGIAEAGYAGPQFYNSIPDALERGTLYVSAYGGGTCNTEFEFLTSTSMASVGAGKYPYVQYDLSSVDSLARQFKVLGYTTSAIHPNRPANWSRDEVYTAMDFDAFYSIADFDGAPTFHSGVTDRSTYDKILDLLAADDDPQFIFDVTMQNHSGYDQGNIPGELLTSYEPAGVSEKNNAKLNEYLSCIEASDHDLAYFMGRLRALDRPVVLVFFGDHQPNITTAYNDAYYPNEDEIRHAERAYQTTYFVWANYDVAAAGQQSERIDTSANYLAGLLTSSIGAPMTEHQEAQIALRESIPCINLYGYQGADGEWYALGSASPYASAYEDGLYIGYLNFGDAVG